MYDRTIFENLESSYQQCILLIKIYVFIYLLSDFCHKIKMYNFEPYNVLLAIATNIAVLLMTAFVLQGHIYESGQCYNNIYFDKEHTFPIFLVCILKYSHNILTKKGTWIMGGGYGTWIMGGKGPG